LECPPDVLLGLNVVLPLGLRAATFCPAGTASLDEGTSSVAHELPDALSRVAWKPELLQLDKLIVEGSLELLTSKLEAIRTPFIKAGLGPYVRLSYDCFWISICQSSTSELGIEFRLLRGRRLRSEFVPA
jgi:hypothetical protein